MQDKKKSVFDYSAFRDVFKSLIKDEKQKDVAIKLNCSPQTVSRLLKGLQDPSVEMLAKISDIYDCSIDYLLGRDTYSEDDYKPRYADFLQMLNYLVRHGVASIHIADEHEDMPELPELMISSVIFSEQDDKRIQQLIQEYDDTFRYTESQKQNGGIGDSLFDLWYKNKLANGNDTIMTDNEKALAKQKSNLTSASDDNLHEFPWS